MPAELLLNFTKEGLTAAPSCTCFTYRTGAPPAAYYALLAAHDLDNGLAVNAGAGIVLLQFPTCNPVINHQVSHALPLCSHSGPGYRESPGIEPVLGEFQYVAVHLAAADNDGKLSYSLCSSLPSS